MTITSSAGQTQTFSASADSVPGFFGPGSYSYFYSSWEVEGTKTLNWSGVDWVDFTSQYTKAKVTTFVLTTADPGSAAVPEIGQVAASLLLLAGLGGYVFIKRRKTAKPALAPIAA